MMRELANTAEYQDWQWNLAVQLRQTLADRYADNEGEVACVEAIVNEIARSGPPVSTGVQGMRVAVEAASAFLHGHRSQVKFSVGGTEHQRELADLLVLGSYVEDGALRWQRVCFIQAKRGSAPKPRSPSRFSIDEWQLALLQAFPAFEGLPGGFFSGMRCHLRNRTGMLGAYGFLTAPGDFTIISARVLNNLLGGRKSIVGKELTPAMISELAGRIAHHQPSFAPLWPFDPENCAECRDIVDHCFPYPWRHFRDLHSHPHHGKLHAQGNPGEVNAGSVLSCLSLDEFVDSWTSLQLGEMWLPGTAAASDQALGQSLLGLVSRVAQSTDGLSNLLGLMTEAIGNDVLPPENEPAIWRSGDGGLGILSFVATRNQID